MTIEFEPIVRGDPITVVFGNAIPDLQANFMRFLSFPDKLGSTLVVTTPLGETNPDVAVTHYIDDYLYMRAGAGTTGAGIDEINIDIGDSVTIYFGKANGNNLFDLTGTVTAINASLGAIELDVGGDTFVAKDWWYLEKN